MSLPWYHLERPTRMLLLRCYYATAALAYPVYTVYNWNVFLPTKAEVLNPTSRSLQEEIINPLNIKKV